MLDSNNYKSSGIFSTKEACVRMAGNRGPYLTNEHAVVSLMRTAP